jgi:hypothetical protein
MALGPDPFRRLSINQQVVVRFLSNPFVVDETNETFLVMLDWDLFMGCAFLERE